MWSNGITFHAFIVTVVKLLVFLDFDENGVINNSFISYGCFQHNMQENLFTGHSGHKHLCGCLQQHTRTYIGKAVVFVSLLEVICNFTVICKVVDPCLATKFTEMKIQFCKCNAL